MHSCLFYSKYSVSKSAASLLLLLPLLLPAQCPSPVAVFPYYENFETSAGGWTSGGSGTSWAWGAPAKAVIGSAASGVNAWIIGGLGGSAYNPGERSWLESPCFDFSGLDEPYIRFKIWWETERQYDGSNLQYSLDNGATWTHVGVAFDTLDCRNANWYNSFFITNLDGLSNPRPGWSGTVQPNQGSCLGGQGSGGWVEARHVLPELAGQPGVLLRFTFGAGTTCNAYDGIAIDDIYLEEAPATVEIAAANATNVSCPGGADGSAAVTVSGGAAPLTYAWSGAVSNGPQAIGLVAGEYSVTVTDAAQCRVVANFTIEQPAALQITSAVEGVDCLGGGGTATLTVSGGVPPYQYAWPAPVTGNAPVATMLPVGIYTVTVSDQTGCTTTVAVPVALASDGLMLTVADQQNPACNGLADGSITVQASGGAWPYQYTWSPAVTTGTTATSLEPGAYTITVTDTAGCTATATAELADPPAFEAVFDVGADCGGNDGAIRVLSVQGGTPPYLYSFNGGPDGTETAFTGLAVGVYLLVIEDANDCNYVYSLPVEAAPPNPVTVGPDTTVFAGQSVLLAGDAQRPETITHYAWTPGVGIACDTCPVTLATPLSTTTFTLTATDSSGCTSTASLTVRVEVSPIYVPNVFAPGAVGLNDRFAIATGPGVEAIAALRIYDRWGSLVFEAADVVPDDVAATWDGTVRGKPAAPGVYAYWIRVRMAGGATRLLEGSVTLVR